MTLPQTILATLTYHDIFDYPLTEGEIHKYLVKKKSFPHQVKTALAELRSTKRIGERKGHYYLKNRQDIVKTRIQRSRYSKKKYKKAAFFANILKIVPTIRLVAISGALAMQNSYKNDDIDLVIITSSGALWTTRFLANVLLFPFKRKPQPSRLVANSYSLITNNKACLNVFIDESNLKIAPQNLYTAHEICQMRPLWGRDETYSRFIKANKWVKKYLPNWQPFSSSVILTSPSVIPAPPPVIPAEAGIHNIRGVHKKALVELALSLSKGLALVAENFLKKFQLFYMHSKISTERIGKHQLFFHPLNTQEWVLEEFQKRLKRLDLA